MLDTTKKAIVALLHADDTATEKERQRVVDALKGEKSQKIISYGEAGERLGLCKNTIYNLVKIGRLEGVQGNRRKMGVTLESVKNFK